MLEQPGDRAQPKHPSDLGKRAWRRRNRAKPEADDDGVERSITKRKGLRVGRNENDHRVGTFGAVAGALEHAQVRLCGDHRHAGAIVWEVETCASGDLEHVSLGRTHDVAPPLSEASALGDSHDEVIQHGESATH